jgi:hypothetical protein
MACKNFRKSSLFLTLEQTYISPSPRRKPPEAEMWARPGTGRSVRWYKEEKGVPYCNKCRRSNDTNFIHYGGHVTRHQVSPCQQASADAIGYQSHDS